MHSMRPAILMLSCAALTLLACGRAAEPNGTGLALRVAPLDLPGVDFACYDIQVTGSAGPVVSLGEPLLSYLAGDTGAICSWQYGNPDGGDIAYVAPCDADDGDAESPAEATNTVTVWFDGLYVDADGDHVPEADVGDWQNPCPSGCSLPATCRENADTSVVFDFTVMRNARQGFFDVAVSFEDIFCSAKLDCVDALLHRPGGARDLTAVLGFACTSGADTCLYVDAVTLTCDNGTWTIDPTLGEGSIPENSPVLYGAAVYSGDEAFTAFQKRYWNVALGLDEAAFSAAQNCTLTWSASASEEAFTDNTTPENATYPRIVWSREIIVDGELACGSHALNEITLGETSASVATTYTPLDEPYEFDFSNCEEIVPPEEARWMIGNIELVAYDHESGTFSVRDATTASPGNTIVSSSWAIEASPYGGMPDGVAWTSPLAGDENTFTFTSRVGWDGYVGCERALGIPEVLGPFLEGLEDLSTSGIFLNQVFYPFSEPVFIKRDGEPTGDEQLLYDELEAAFNESALPYSAIVPGALFSPLDLEFLAFVTGLSAPPGQSLFPSVLLWFDRISPPTPGFPGDDVHLTYFEPLGRPAGCTTIGTTTGTEQIFRVTLTTTDVHGETVRTRALIWNFHNEKGGVFVGGDITRAGTTLTFTATPVGTQDHAPPGTTFNHVWLDHDGDGSPDADDLSGVFTHDFAISGTHRGSISADDDPYWGMGFGEIYSEFYFFVP